MLSSTESQSEHIAQDYELKNTTRSRPWLKRTKWSAFTIVASFRRVRTDSRNALVALLREERYAALEH